MGGPDNTTVGEAASGVPNFSFRLNGCGTYSLKTSVTDSGYGACGGFEFARGYYDGYYFLGADYRWLTSRGKLFPGGGEGTTSTNEANVIDLTFGKTERTKIWDHRAITKTFTRKTSVGIGWQDLGGGTRTVGDETFAMEGTSWKALHFDKSYLWGFEFVPAGSRFVIHPQIGLGIATLYPFAGIKDRSEFPWSPRDIHLSFKLNFGYNDASVENLLHAPINDYDVARKLTDMGLGYFQRGFSTYDYDIPTAEGEELLNQLHMGVGGGSQQTEDIKILRALTFGLGSMEISDDIDFYYRARRGGKSGSAYTALIARGVGGVSSIIGGAVTGVGGEELTAAGIGDLQSFYGALLTDSDLTATEQFGARFGVAAGVQLLGGLLSASSISDGGGRGMVANTMTPDPTNAGIVSRTVISYAPVSGFFSKGGNGSRGSIAMTNYIPLSDRWNMLTYLELTSHAMDIANLGKRAGNSLDDDYSSEYASVGLPTTIRTGVGFGYDVALGDVGVFVPNIGVHTAELFNGKRDTAVGLNAGFDFLFNLPKGFKLGVGAKGLLDVPFHHSPVNFDIQPTLSAGYTN